MPQEKNREHILPQWLLRMTGNPSRIVHFGINLKTRKPIEFSWSSFVVPVCKTCNNEYSELENTAKSIVEKLSNSDLLTAKEYLELLDWLDKVRVGAWIAYHYLQQNPTNIEPSFYIKSRIAAKDRLLALYPMPTQLDGLNIFGAETLLFHRQPSCFGLRINKLLLINMSSDYLVSARCGFPFPQSMKLLLDGPGPDVLEGSQFKFSGKTKHPILLPRLKKPSVLLYQPILQAAPEKIYSVLPKRKERVRAYLDSMTFPDVFPVQGKLFREYKDRVEIIQNLQEIIEFDSITGLECAPLSQLAGQVYDFQRYIYRLYSPTSADFNRRSTYLSFMRILEKENLMRKSALT
jgi:hypothetical protein